MKRCSFNLPKNALEGIKDKDSIIIGVTIKYRGLTKKEIKLPYCYKAEYKKSETEWERIKSQSI